MAGNTPTVGVLALQGDFREHLAVLTGLGVTSRTVRRASELDEIDGLVIPGGESTVIDKLSRNFGLAEPIRESIRDGLPVYGTCAGLIMLADTIVNPISGQQSFGGLDVAVRRNAFGEQTESFEADLDIPEVGEAPVHAVFIRAPVIETAGESVDRLATLADGRIVAARQGNLLGTSFHPEMSGETRFHELFLRMIAER
ncbi:pyridoxal 5'-phosphate synthase glutaminase subunit PdxT [Marisediminicola sp. LYQ134]|uniref:pyridoxal 5'-phosphate synthase glutaminase subunit PdxT n=1 Tax=unclassified Marisediminicola TaxID=2618316 RepID=UPI003982E312